MQTNTDPCEAGPAPASPQPRSRARRVLAGAGLLLLGALAAATVDELLPKLPDASSGLAGRVSWYVEHRQYVADLHSLACAADYLVRPSPAPAVVASLEVPTAPPVAVLESRMPPPT